jgi:hypothetical protein
MATTGAKDQSRLIAEGHVALRETIRELEAAKEPARLSRLLRVLNEKLEEHFAEEEGQDGLAAAVPSSVPHQVTKLERLFEEHGQFLSSVAGLSARLESIERVLGEARSDIWTLCHNLRSHERHESELLRDAINTDVGTGD